MTEETHPIFDVVVSVVVTEFAMDNNEHAPRTLSGPEETDKS